MRKLLFLVSLMFAASPAIAADNYAATAGSGLTFAAKDNGSGVLFSRFIGCDNTTTTQCWSVDSSGRLLMAVPTGAFVDITGAVATSAHGCSVLGYGVLGCLGQIDDDIKGPLPVVTGPLAASSSGLATGALMIGGQFLSTQPAGMTNAQQAAFLLAARGGLLVATGADPFNVKQSGTYGAAQLSSAAFTTSATGDVTIVTRAVGTIKIYGLDYSCGAQESAISYKNGAAGTVIGGPYPNITTFFKPISTEPWYTTTGTNSFVMNKPDTTTCGGTVYYLDN